MTRLSTMAMYIAFKPETQGISMEDLSVGAAHRQGASGSHTNQLMPTIVRTTLI